jgi:hypothetical protein
MIYRNKILGSMVCLAVAGCTGITETQLALSKFDDSAHSVSTTQITFFRAAQTAECTTISYSDAYDYANSVKPVVGANGAKQPVNLTPSCTPKELTSAQLAIRQDLMNSITLYADQIQALASSGDDKNLDSNSQSLASKINSFAKGRGFSSSGLGIAADVEAAIIGITDLIIDHSKLNEIKAAAKSKGLELKLVVGELKKENTDLSAAIDSNLGVQKSEIATMVASSKGAAAVFFATIQARSLVQNPLAQGAPASDPNTPTTNVGQLNDALDGIVTANDAIATASTGGIVSAVSDLVARAQKAQSIQAALSK